MVLVAVGRVSRVTGTLRALSVAAAATATLAMPAAARADVAPYGQNDAGGFRNVLPAGENGFDTAAQLATNQLDNSQRPPHFDDQLPLYTGLVFASPALTHDQIPNFF